MNRILVTGGAGFLGSHLCRELLSSGEQVFCLDNLHTGMEHNICDLKVNKNFSFLRHDVIEPINFIEVDQIYNLACPASPTHYQSDPVQTLKTNVLGAINVLELAKKNQATILQASTSEVYGDPLEHPQTESYWGNVNSTGIRACYDEGKRCAETLFFDYYRLFDLPIKVVRIFNTYGPVMNPLDGRVVSNFIMQALRNEPITIFGDGTQTRSFCFFSDLITGLKLAMQLDRELTGPINLGNPCEFTVLELAEMIIRKTDSKSEITFKSLPSDDPVKRRPDISFAKSKLGWNPSTTLSEGLDKTIPYFKKFI